MFDCPAVQHLAACGLLLVRDKATGEVVQWRYQKCSCWKISLLQRSEIKSVQENETQCKSSLKIVLYK